MGTEKKICPCCGMDHIKEEYDICQTCGWEYDPVQNDRPDLKGGANSDSSSLSRRVMVRQNMGARSLNGCPGT